MDYQLWLGDCLKEMDRIEAGSVDAIIADLPYNVTNCHWDILIPFEPLWKHYKRVIKKNGAVVLFGSQPFTSLLVMSNLKSYKHRWIWNKESSGNFAVAKYMPLTIDEDILVFTAKGERVNYYPIMNKGKYHNRGGGNSTKNGRGFGGLKNVISYSDEYFPKSILNFPAVSRYSRLHESQKPVALLSYLIKTYTNEGEIVLDSTMGSGSTGEACLRTGRRFIGIEKDLNYFNVATQRLARVAAELRGELNHLPMFAEAVAV